MSTLEAGQKVDALTGLGNGYDVKKIPDGAYIIGGGIGNLIDRIFLGYVIDYLQLSFFSPVCNFSDYAITVGTVLLVIYLLFFSDSSKAKPQKEKDND